MRYDKTVQLHLRSCNESLFLHSMQSTSQDLQSKRRLYHICLVHAPMPSLVSHLAADEIRSRIWRETFGTHEFTSVCEHKDDLACDEHGPHSTSVVIMPMVRLNHNHASWWSGRVASLHWSTRVRTVGRAHVHDTASMSYVVTRAMETCLLVDVSVVLVRVFAREH